MTTEPSILTIVLNYRTPEMTLKAVAAALREMEGLRGEIALIENGSADNSVEVLSHAIADNGWGDRVRLITSDHNGGFGAGCNIGIRAGMADGGRPDFVYLLNSDAFPQPGAIRGLRDFLMANPRAGMVGSFVRGTDGEPHRTAFRFPSIAGEFEMSARTGVISRLLHRSIVAIPIPEAETRIDWVAGASLMMRQDMLDAIGGFDETFFLYFEETDLCHRAARAGWQTHYLPSSEVLHIGSASTGMKGWTRTPRYWFDSRSHYFSKTHGRAYAALATLARVGGLLVWKLRRLISDKPQADPDRFLGDLVAHSLATPFRRRPNTREVQFPRIVLEDKQ